MCDGGGEGGWLFRGQGGFALLFGRPPQLHNFRPKITNKQVSRTIDRLRKEPAYNDAIWESKQPHQIFSLKKMIELCRAGKRNQLPRVQKLHFS